MGGRHTSYEGDPVIIVGNGPVGQTTALLLSRWGIGSVVLERLPGRTVVGSKAICQQRDVLDIWSAIGVGDQIVDEGTTWRRARTYYREHEIFCVEFEDPGLSPYPPWVNISQSRVETILDEAIARDPRIDVRWSHEVIGMAQDDGNVIVTCSTPTGEQTFRAPYAVICAGLGASDIRAALGVTFEGRSFDDHFLICDIRARLPGWEDERRFFFDPGWNPGRQILIHHCPDSTFRIDWQVPDDFDLGREETSGALDARIRKIVGDEPYEVVWKSVYRFHSRLVDRMRVGRVLLAGDIAHVYAPFGARGLNSGVQDAENAAWKIAFVLHGWSPEHLLETYDGERRPAAVENLEVTSATMRFLVPQTPEESTRRRDVLERAVADGSVRSEVDSGRLAEPYWYIDSPLTTPDETRPFTGRPAPGTFPPPSPGVIVPDLPVRIADRPDVRRLRELVRDGLLALAAPGADVASVEAALGASCRAPARVLEMEAIDDQGVFAETFGYRIGETWIIRPDGHIAAIVGAGDADGLTTAIRRLTGDLTPRRPAQV